MTQITSQNFSQLVSQVQIAHRLVVGFYQRLLPAIEHIANELDCSIWHWDPIETNRPCKRSKQPADYWAWDMMPLFASEHSYCRTDGKIARIGDVSVSFYVYLDENFDSEKRKKLGVPEDEEPDAIKLPIGDAVVNIYLFRCDRENGQSFEKQYEESDYVDEQDSKIQKWQKVSDHMSGMLLRKTLVEFISDPERIIADLRPLLNTTPI